MSQRATSVRVVYSREGIVNLFGARVRLNKGSKVIEQRGTGERKFYLVNQEGKRFELDRANEARNIGIFERAGIPQKNLSGPLTQQSRTKGRGQTPKTVVTSIIKRPERIDPDTGRRIRETVIQTSRRPTEKIRQEFQDGDPKDGYFIRQPNGQLIGFRTKEELEDYITERYGQQPADRLQRKIDRKAEEPEPMSYRSEIVSSTGSDRDLALMSGERSFEGGPFGLATLERGQSFDKPQAQKVSELVNPIKGFLAETFSPVGQYFKGIGSETTDYFSKQEGGADYVRKQSVAIRQDLSIPSRFVKGVRAFAGLEYSPSLQKGVVTAEVATLATLQLGGMGTVAVLTAGEQVARFRLTGEFSTIKSVAQSATRNSVLVGLERGGAKIVQVYKTARFNRIIADVPKGPVYTKQGFESGLMAESSSSINLIRQGMLTQTRFTIIRDAKGQMVGFQRQLSPDLTAGTKPEALGLMRSQSGVQTTLTRIRVDQSMFIGAGSKTKFNMNYGGLEVLKNPVPRAVSEKLGLGFAKQTESGKVVSSVAPTRQTKITDFFPKTLESGRILQNTGIISGGEAKTITVNLRDILGVGLPSFKIKVQSTSTARTGSLFESSYKYNVGRQSPEVYSGGKLTPSAGRKIFPVIITPPLTGTGRGARGGLGLGSDVRGVSDLGVGSGSVPRFRSDMGSSLRFNLGIKSRQSTSTRSTSRSSRFRAPRLVVTPFGIPLGPTPTPRGGGGGIKPPLPVFGGGSAPRRRKKGSRGGRPTRINRRSSYTPSVEALSFGIRGVAPQRLTGLELRPIKI